MKCAATLDRCKTYTGPTSPQHLHARGHTTRVMHTTVHYKCDTLCIGHVSTCCGSVGAHRRARCSCAFVHVMQYSHGTLSQPTGITSRPACQRGELAKHLRWQAQ